MQPRRNVLWFRKELRGIRKKTLASIVSSIWAQGTATSNSHLTKTKLVDAIVKAQQCHRWVRGGMLFYPQELRAIRRQYLEHIAVTYWGLGTYRDIGTWSLSKLRRQIAKAQVAWIYAQSVENG